MHGADSDGTAWRAALARGHARRSAGDAAGAERAYAEAAGHAPFEAEPALHRGHALRLLGHPDQAAAAYALAAAMDPYSPDVRDAERRLRDGETPPAAPPAPSPASLPASAGPPPDATPPPGRTPPPAGRRLPTAPSPAHPPARSRRASMLASASRLAGQGIGGPVLDVTDLLLHLRHSRIPTGIQRVTVGIAAAAVRRMRDHARIVALDHGAWRTVPPILFGTLLSLVAGDEDGWDAAREELDAAMMRAPVPSFAPSDALVSLGSPWGVEGHLLAVRRTGARWIPFLHDCVPLDRPEHCVRSLVEAYARWFSAVALQASGMICNSEATRTAGEAHLDSLMPGLALPTGVVRLDADPRGAAPDEAAARALLGPHAGHPYVLFVATIESRKDHLTVLRAWLSLIRLHGRARVPRLVLVGSKGWHAEAALGLLENAPDLAAHVAVIHGASDGALAGLYAGCLFTLYNSHLEGWGLPVTESIAWGKVPVVADLPALRESGGEAAVFVEPQNEADMAAAVEALLDPATLAHREAILRDAPPPRRWEEVETELADLAAALGATPTLPPTARASLPPGERLAMGRSASGRPDLAAAFAEGLRATGDWAPTSPEGAPFRGEATLRMPLGAAMPAGPARLGLEVDVPDGSTMEVEIRLDGAAAARGRIAASGTVATTIPFPMPEGVRDVELVLRLPPGETGAVRALLLCGENDLLGRLAFIEAQAMPTLAT